MTPNDVPPNAVTPTAVTPNDVPATGAAPGGAILTIAIPTFDRNAILERTVAALLPQLTNACRLLVLDNHSPTPVAETLAPLLARHPGVDAQVVRHPVNIGGNANVLRCIERCETEWLWVLGDDDLPEPDAVERVLGDVAAHLAALFLNYRTELFERRTGFVTRGRREFVERMDSLSNVLFISAGVFRGPAVRSQLRLAYAYAYSNAPHLIALIAALGDADACVFSTAQIAHWEMAPFAQRWSMVNIALSFPTLLDVPFGPDIRAALDRKLQAIHPPLPGLVRQLQFIALESGDRREARFVIDQVCARRLALRPGGRAHAAAAAARLLVRWPRLTSPAVEWVARRLLGEAARENRLQDRVGRI